MYYLFPHDSVQEIYYNICASVSNKDVDKNQFLDKNQCFTGWLINIGRISKILSNIWNKHNEDYSEIKDRLNIPTEWGVVVHLEHSGGALLIDDLATYHFTVILSLYSVVY